MSEVQREGIGIESYMKEWKVWPKASEMLLEGMTLSAVARWLKEHEPEARVRSDNALMKALSRLRTELKKTEAMGKLAELKRKADEAASKADGSPEQVDTYVDVLESLASLYLLQMDRIRMGREIEEKVKYLIARMTQDIGEAREILKFMFEVQQDLGLAKRKPLQFEGKLAVLTFEQRQQVGRVLEMVRQKVLAKQLESKVVREVAEEVVEQVVDEQVSNGNGNVIDVEFTNDRMTRSTGKVIPIGDKFVDSEVGGLPDKPWEE